ncbi:hypothetical protein ACFWVM_29350 [Nocardia fluminea]|uniref:hypothetical protein n=1 Tax=Nocardia fluminea TaxID=134984 RepID=UPI003667B9F8
MQQNYRVISDGRRSLVLVDGRPVGSFQQLGATAWMFTACNYADGHEDIFLGTDFDEGVAELVRVSTGS